MANWVVEMERPTWSLEAAEEARVKGDPRLGYSFDSSDKKKLAVDASSYDDAIEKARDMEETRLEQLGKAKLARLEFEDLVAYEFWKRENRYWPILAVENG